MFARYLHGLRFVNADSVECELRVIGCGFGGWLFRGQGRDVPLIPSAFREDGKLASLTQRDITTYDQRRLAERDVLIQFFDIADRRGLVLPDDSQEFRSTLETLKSPRGDDQVAKGTKPDCR